MLTIAAHLLLGFASGLGSPATSHAVDTTSQLTRDGLWLIAFGGVLVAIGLVVGGHLGGLSTRSLGAQGQAGDRLAFSLGFVGAALVAVGGVIAAIEEAPEVWLMLLSVIGSAGLVYLVAAWRLWIDMRREVSRCVQSLSGSLSEGIRANVEETRNVCGERAKLRHLVRYALASNKVSDGAARRSLGLPGKL